MVKTVNILGVTGSVGQSAVDVIRAHPDKFKVHCVTAHRHVERLAEHAIQLNADIAVITSPESESKLIDALQHTDIKVISGVSNLCAVLGRPVDLTLAAIVGMAGLAPLMAAIPHSKAIAIANKEPLVAAGELVLAAARKHGTVVLPVDSEHNAIFQVFDPARKNAVERLILTASGGPFRTASLDVMKSVTPEQAVKHPNWSMGAKISVDSATMMNKALEVIEAHHLFGIPHEKIDVLVHPQSVIHSMVAYADGSVLAQLGAPDMRTPVTYALGWPERLATPGQRLDFSAMSKLEFEPPDPRRFPAIPLAYECLKSGQAACLILNAANEIAVEAFMNREIGFLDIVETCKAVLDQMPLHPLSTLDDVLAFDENVRHLTKTVIVSK